MNTLSKSAIFDFFFGGGGIHFQGGGGGLPELQSRDFGLSVGSLKHSPTAMGSYDTFSHVELIHFVQELGQLSQYYELLSEGLTAGHHDTLPMLLNLRKNLQVKCMFVSAV